MSLTSDVNTLPILNDDEVIKYFAKLSLLEYEKIREKEAEKLGLRVSILDKLVKLERDNIITANKTVFQTIEPWHQPVNLAALLNDIENVFNKFLAFPSSHEAKAIALWILHTHCINAVNISPILYINSPEKRCGKTTLLTILQRLVNRPLMASNVTSSALFRSIEKWQPTFILDEADTFMRHNEELRGIINSGHTRDLAYVIRCTGDNHEPTYFSTWCAKVIAGIGRLAGTIEDRAIMITMRRKLPSETRAKFNESTQPAFDVLLKKCLRFAADNFEKFKIMPLKISESLNDRASDNWKPLLLIAEIAGGEWPNHAKNAALSLSRDKQDVDNLNIELLIDIKKAFKSKKSDRLSTEDLITEICSDKERPWRTFNNDKQITPHQLARILSNYGITSGTIRLPSNKTPKGYYLHSFSDAFARYIPPSQDTTPPQPLNHKDADNHYNRHTEEMWRSEKSNEVFPHMVCGGVADEIATYDGISKEMINARDNQSIAFFNINAMEIK